LYANRDEQEAARFINNLVSFLKPSSESYILDLACGKGRHSRTLNKLGFRVKGVDLSPESIAFAQQFENEKLHFGVQDMRQALDEKFSHIFNLFTSFGYFDHTSENDKVMAAIAEMTNKGGLLVIDYLNSEKVRKNIAEAPAKEVKVIDNIRFEIRRKIDDKHVFKFIDVIDGKEKHSFSERVQLLDLEDFKKLLSTHGFTLNHAFGNFDLADFDPLSAERLILIAEKI
jgi:2-polyprenyl-3-methyl-5-hydroxy-6-metoxy-1,4-benzoquinol methylase